jgi:hypothetical protein
MLGVCRFFSFLICTPPHPLPPIEKICILYMHRYVGNSFVCFLICTPTPSLKNSVSCIRVGICSLEGNGFLFLLICERMSWEPFMVMVGPGRDVPLLPGYYNGSSFGCRTLCHFKQTCQPPVLVVNTTDLKPKYLVDL